MTTDDAATRSATALDGVTRALAVSNIVTSVKPYFRVSARMLSKRPIVVRHSLHSSFASPATAQSLDLLEAFVAIVCSDAA